VQARRVSDGIYFVALNANGTTTRHFFGTNGYLADLRAVLTSCTTPPRPHPAGYQIILGLWQYRRATAIDPTITGSSVAQRSTFTRHSFGQWVFAAPDFPRCVGHTPPTAYDARLNSLQFDTAQNIVTAPRRFMTRAPGGRWGDSDALAGRLPDSQRTSWIDVAPNAGLGVYRWARKSAAEPAEIGIDSSDESTPSVTIGTCQPCR